MHLGWLRGIREKAALPSLFSHSCQCREYVSAEELCDAQCLARAPQLSLVLGPHRELILSMKDEAGDSTQRVRPVPRSTSWKGSLCLLGMGR